MINKSLAVWPSVILALTACGPDAPEPTAASGPDRTGSRPAARRPDGPREPRAAAPDRAPTRPFEQQLDAQRGCAGSRTRSVHAGRAPARCGTPGPGRRHLGSGALAGWQRRRAGGAERRCHTLPGFKSRWTMPRLWANSKPRQVSLAMSMACSRGSRWSVASSITPSTSPPPISSVTM